MSNGNRKKADQLGMPYGTAFSALRKAILFKMAQKLEEDICFHCQLKIESIEQFSIEHKIPWLDNDPALFWDLNNIAFSHLSCNLKAARKSNKIDWPSGQAWCAKCKQMKSVNSFPESKISNRGCYCTQCLASDKAAWRKRTGKH